MSKVLTQFVSVSTAARIAGVTSETVRAWISAGKLKASRVGARGAWRVSREDLAQVLGE